MKKSYKIILSLSTLVLIVLLFIVFKGVADYSQVTDTTEVADSTKVDTNKSFLKDTSKNYIIKEYSNKEQKDIKYIQRFVGTSKGYNTWYGTETLLEKENQFGLFYGELKVLAYPVEVGKSWSVDPFTFTIESIDQTITVPAGTFKNVVEVKTTDKNVKEYNLTYYAKGVGQILRESVDSKSKKTIRYEVQEMNNK